MKVDDVVRYKKIQYHITNEAAKISALLSGKTDKYEYLTAEEILLSDKKSDIKTFLLRYVFILSISKSF